MPLTRGLPIAGLLMMLALVGCASRDTALNERLDDNAQGLSMERALIISHAQQSLGTPYRLGGNTPDGLDCSGLVEMVYQAAGISVPRTADQQFRQLPSVDTPRPGDVLFFGARQKATHVGIYRGQGQMIHAPGSGREVVSVPLDVDYWQQRFLGAASPTP